MKKYKDLLVDLDDTLLDFDAAEAYALPQIFDLYNFPLTDERRAKFREINRSLWDALEEGTVTRDELMTTRFSKTFAYYGIEIDGKVADEKYRELLADCKVFIEDAYEVIEELSKHYNLYIASNGISHTQHTRLEKTGLVHFFKGVFVSEDSGYQKPMEQFFDHAFERMEDFDKERTLMIGDSFNADIVGGHRSGIDTCWLNRHGIEKTKPVTPTYEIQKLEQLFDILQVKVHG